MVIDKEKQREGVVQNDKIFLYKLYTILLESSEIKNSKLISL